ncbi:unnamed protein product [Rhizophagus irregularis]|nr:unnamed protein product [Rhizophagus irregularis]CAB5364245.1 unnamed protein product [Rhizophagus irregularis]
MNNYLRNPRFYHQSEQDSESALVSRNTNETGKRLGGMDEHPIILDFEKEKKLSTDMSILHKSLLPTKESHEKRKELADNVKKVLNDEFPNKEIEVHMFGSSMNELGTTQSDVDLCVTTQWNGLKNIHVLSDCLKKHMKVEQIVSKAKVPIVRLFDQNLDLACDINVNNTLALHNTRLIRKYVSIDPRVQPLAMIVKHWARKRVLNDAAKGGTISTYTWTCIILNFLQMRDPPILPILHQIPHKDIDPIMVNGEDASFYEDVDTLSQFGSKNKETIGGLLFAFFRRMAFEFNYDEHVISLRQGKYLTKAEKGWDTCKGWKMLCVEEPFNTARNLGNSADDVSVNGLIAEFKRAYEILYESACLEKLCEQYQFPLNHYINNNHYYPPSRYRQLSKRNNKNNPMWKPNRRNYYPRYHQQNGQNNCLSNTTDNLHDMNGKSNDLQDGEEDGSSMRRFDSVSHTSHYNGSEESTPVSVYYHYENNDSLTRKQFDNLQYQSKRYNNHHNVSKDDEQLRSQSKQKNSFYSKKRNDDQSHNYGQSQDSEHEGFVRYVDSIPNQNQPKNSSHNKKGSAARFQPSYSDQKIFYLQNTITLYDSDNNIKYNNNNSYSRHPNIHSDSDQKSFVHDSEKRPYYKSHSNKNVHNSKQVEEPIIDDLSSNSNFDRSNPISSPKSNNKSNNKNRFNKHTQPQRQYQKPTGNVDFNNNNYSCNNDKVDDSFSSNSIPPSNSGSTNLTASYSMYHQLYNRQSGDGSTQYQRRMSHQSSSDGSNSQTSGNTSNTSNTSYSSNCTKNNYQKTSSNQNNYQQNHQNKLNNNNNNNSKRRKHLNNNNTNGYNNSVNGNFRTNNTTNNSSMTMALSYNDSNLQDVPFIPSYINQGQGGQHGNDYNLNCDINGYKGSNGSFKSNNNNSNSSNSWKSSNGHYYNKTTNGNSNTNSGMKLANGGNNPSNRSVNSNNSNNNFLRSNCPNFNNNYNNNYMKNQNNNNAIPHKPITGSNYKPFDGSNNNPNSQIKNFNKNGGGNNKKRTNKNRTGVKAENKEDGVSYQLQYSQEGSVQERQNKKVGQNGQSNNSGKGKGHKKHPSCPKQNVAFQQQ